MILFLLPLKLFFPSPIILLFSVLLVSHDQLCHAKNWLFVNSKILILLRSQLTSVHWDNNDALSDCFNKTLADILDKFAPLKTRTMVNFPKVPWFNDDIKQFKRQRRRLGKKAVKTDLPGDWNNYHKVRNECSAFLKSARVNYFSNLIDQCADDYRKLFRVVNSLCMQPLKTALPEKTDPTKLANEVGTFFLKKVKS